MKPFCVLLACGGLFAFASCEEHPVSALASLPGQHEERATGAGHEGQGESAAPEAHGEEATTPPAYFPRAH